MVWQVTWKADPRLTDLANRHYTRRYPGIHRFFTPPGKTLPLVTEDGKAGWVTLIQAHGPNAGQWVNCFFRNEAFGELLSSSLIQEAVDITIKEWGNLPESGILTYVDTRKVRHKRDFGRCYRKAGWKEDGYSTKGLLKLRFTG